MDSDDDSPPPTPAQILLSKTEIGIHLSDADEACSNRVLEFIKQETKSAQLDENHDAVALHQGILTVVTGLVAGTIPHHKMYEFLESHARILEVPGRKLSDAAADEDAAPETPSKLPVASKQAEKGAHLEGRFFGMNLNDSSSTGKKAATKDDDKDDDDYVGGDEGYHGDEDDGLDAVDTVMKDLTQPEQREVSESSMALTDVGLSLAHRIEHSLPSNVIGISEDMKSADVIEARRQFMNGLLLAGRTEESKQSSPFDEKQVQTACRIFFGLFTRGQLDRINRVLGHGGEEHDLNTELAMAQQIALRVSQDRTAPAELQQFCRAWHAVESMDGDLHPVAKDIMYLCEIDKFASTYKKLMGWAVVHNNVNHHLTTYVRKKGIVVPTGRGKGKTSTIVQMLIRQLLGLTSKQTLHNRISRAKTLQQLTKVLGRGVIGLVSKKDWNELVKLGQTKTFYAARRFVNHVPDAKQICSMVNDMVVVPVLKGQRVELALLSSARRGTFLEKLQAARDNYTAPLPQDTVSDSDSLFDSDPELPDEMEIDQAGRLMTPSAASSIAEQTGGGEDVGSKMKSAKSRSDKGPADSKLKDTHDEHKASLPGDSGSDTDGLVDSDLDASDDGETDQAERSMTPNAAAAIEKQTGNKDVAADAKSAKPRNEKKPAGSKQEQQTTGGKDVGTGVKPAKPSGYGTVEDLEFGTGEE